MPRAPAPCPDGKIRNPATGRCVDARGPTGRTIRMAAGNTNMTPCPAGYTRNAATGRCVRARAADAAPRACPAGMIRNPATGRCVKTTGAIGRRLAAAAAAGANRTPNRTPNRPNRTPYVPPAPARTRRRRTEREPRRRPPTVAPMNALPERTPSPVVATPTTPSLSNLNARCSNDTDPVMMTEFKNLNRNELKSIVAIGRGARKHCYMLDSIYGVYATAVRDNNPVKDPLDPSYVLSTAEIKTIDRLMKKRDPAYRPPQRTMMNYRGYTLEIRPDGAFYHLLVNRPGLSTADFGYIPANIETRNTGSANTTSATMVTVIRELWDQRRLLRTIEPLRPRGVHLFKSKRFWSTDKINKFRALMRELQQIRG